MPFKDPDQGRAYHKVYHMVPLIRGGEHSPDNVVPCCQSCNSRKGLCSMFTMVVA
jgi:5-methylcytosine-specific restriction endonuclease McrA